MVKNENIEKNYFYFNCREYQRKIYFDDSSYITEHSYV